MTLPSKPNGIAPISVREVSIDSPPGLVHDAWLRQMPWLVQGCTTRGSTEPPFDLGLFTDGSPTAHVEACWAALLTATGLPRAIHSRQAHEAEVRVHGEGLAGLHLVDDCDGHVTGVPGVLVAVTTADCVPVFVVDPERRVVAALHAGWRGAAAGVLERGVRAIAEEAGSLSSELLVHFGPSICGECYEVGPEVFGALDQVVPSGPTPIDLRAVLADRAVSAGVPTQNVSVSEHCTRCTGSDLYSHRGGDPERQVGYIGIRP